MAGGPARAPHLPRAPAPGRRRGPPRGARRLRAVRRAFRLLRAEYELRRLDRRRLHAGAAPARAALSLEHTRAVTALVGADLIGPWSNFHAKRAYLCSERGGQAWKA